MGARGLLLVAGLLSMWQCDSPSEAPPRQLSPVAAPIPSGRSVIQGLVTAADGQPISGVHVFNESQSTLTGADGRYALRGLARGSHTVYASKDGFIQWQYKQAALDERDTATVEVGDEQTVDGIDIGLPKGAVVTGRVLDPGGRVVSNGRVMPVELVFEHGRRRFRPKSTTWLRAEVLTNERGEFALSGLPPGDYFVLALPPLGPRVRLDPDPRQPAPVPTLYPAATGLTTASRLRLDFGDVRNRVDITLSAAERFEIRGVVLDRSGRPAREGRVQARRRGELPSMAFEYGLAGEAAVQPDGRYVLKGLRPAQYGLRALLPTPEGDSVEKRIADRLEATAWSVVDVGQQDMDGVRLGASRLVTVRGGSRSTTPPRHGRSLLATSARSPMPGIPTTLGLASASASQAPVLVGRGVWLRVSRSSGVCCPAAWR